ncbi:MAG: hypothetical protein VX667_00795 [Nitrospinota bacterium]|nr:hypothetical protein [Nitrospinota bacterium]
MKPSSGIPQFKPAGTLFFAILFVGLVLRLIGFNAPLISDELATTSIWAQMPFTQIPVNYQYPNNHILHTVIISVLLKSFGLHPWVLRLPVLLCGVASLVLAYRTALSVAPSRPVALGTSLLLAISSTHIFYSTHARGYMLVMFLAQLCLFQVVRLFSSEERSFFAPRRQIPLNELIWLGVLLMAGTWIIPTFILFEVSLFLFFASILLIRFRKRMGDVFFPPTQIVLVILVSWMGFFIQYFVLISPEMLEQAVVNAARTDLDRFLPEILEEWILPYGSLGTLFLFSGIAGLWWMRGNNRAIFYLSVALLAAPLAVYLALMIGMSSQVPHARIFVYLQPFFFFYAVLGMKVILDKAIERAAGPGRERTSALILAVLWVPLVIVSGRDFNDRLVPERFERERFDQVREYIARLGPNDLVLASNRTHVWFYLYGAGEMRKRVHNIIATGNLGNVLFMEYNADSGVEQVKKDGTDYILLKDYGRFTGNAGEKILLPAVLVESRTSVGPTTFYKIFPSFVSFEYALKSIWDLTRWRVPEDGMLPVPEAETIPGDGLLAVRIEDSLLMIADKKGRQDEPMFGLNINLLSVNLDAGDTVAYLNAGEINGQFVFSETWLGNPWTLDHPYGPRIFKRTWRPVIFLTKTRGPVSIIKIERKNPKAAGRLRGVQSWRMEVPLKTTK